MQVKIVFFTCDAYKKSATFFVQNHQISQRELPLDEIQKMGYNINAFPLPFGTRRNEDERLIAL